MSERPGDKAAKDAALQPMERVPDLPIPPGDSSLPGVLSFNERRQWFHERLTPNSSSYVVSAATRLSGEVDVPSLKKALQAVVDRHEILRTRYFEKDGEPYRHVEPECFAVLEEVDVILAPGVDWQDEVRRLAAEAETTPLDFVRGPLFRFILFRRSASDFVFLRVFNHIVTDAWSDQVFMRDLGDAYSAAVQGNDPNWPEQSMQYADFAAWQRSRLDSTALEGQLHYWREQFAGAPPALEVVTDFPRPAVAGEHAGEVLSRIPGGVAGELSALARAEGATTFMAAIAVYFRLLALYSGQNDLVVGVPVAGRKADGLGDLIGFFINSLPLRVDLDGDPTFRQLLGRVNAVARGAFDHQDLPFDRVVQELRPERDLSRAPVFQTMLAFQNFPRKEASFEGLQLETFVELGSRAAVPCDFAFVIWPHAGEWHAQLLYRADLFEASTMARFMRHYGLLMERAVRDPDAPLSSISVADDEERRLAIEEWSGIRTDYPSDSCVHTLFEQQVEAFPDSVAVVKGADRVSYRELNERANRLAHHLRDLGVGPEGIVGLFGNRAIDSIVAIIAVFKAGGGYLPLDPEAPASRIDYLVGSSGVKVMLVRGADQLSLVPNGVTGIDLADAGQFAALSGANPDNEVSPGNLAYVLFTSGSTGDPKGVEVEHRQIIREVRGCDYFEYPPDRVFSNLAPLWFDVSCIEIWGALLNGAACVIYPERLPTVAGLRGFFAEHGVTTTHIVASLLNVLLDEFPESLRGLKEMFTGGEALDPLHIDRALKVLPDTRIYNGYGPTECATIATCYEVPRGDWTRRRAIPIGRPVSNTTVYILDEQGNVCPPGVPGELHIGGDGVARGYLGDPDLTARRFVPDPFSDRPNARLYRSGDRCRYLEGGLVDFLCRNDEQVKVRGFRIEPGEISGVLDRCDGVRTSAVVARAKPSGERALVAYVVAEADPVPAIEDLKRYLAERLPAYMMPDSFVMLEELPLTPNGKIDTRALPAPADAGPDRPNATPPRNAFELQLTSIWARVLGMTGVGIDDDFFDLGGNSLLALRLFSEMENTVGESLPLATLFQAPTVRRLVELWRDRGKSEGWSCIVPLQPRGSRHPFFCVHGLRGNVIGQRALAQRMGADQPYFAIQAVGLDGITPPLRSVDAMAAHYATEIRNTRPHGPYIIGGHCFGGLVAFEVARLLIQEGESVPLLVMIDAPAPRPILVRRLVREVRSRYALLRNHDRRELMDQTHRIARDRYAPRPYSGNVLQVMSTHWDSGGPSPRQRHDAWDRMIEGEHYALSVDGHHKLILTEPLVASVAAAIGQRVGEPVGEHHE